MKRKLVLLSFRIKHSVQRRQRVTTFIFRSHICESQSERTLCPCNKSEKDVTRHVDQSPNLILFEIFKSHKYSYFTLSLFTFIRSFLPLFGDWFWNCFRHLDSLHGCFIFVAKLKRVFWTVSVKIFKYKRIKNILRPACNDTLQLLTVR